MIYYLTLSQGSFSRNGVVECGGDGRLSLRFAREILCEEDVERGAKHRLDGWSLERTEQVQPSTLVQEKMDHDYFLLLKQWKQLTFGRQTCSSGQ